MSWYSQPIQPIDPVVASQQPKPPFRYVRDNFAGTGQNSHTKPPAQDQSMWQSLLNVQPITQGVLNQRWGYSPFGTNTLNCNRLSNFQSDLLGTRTIIAASLNEVIGLDENGSIYNPTIFSPVAASGIIRSITSRNFQYFCDGNNGLNPSTHLTGDSLKWNGAPTDGVTNIGILTTDVTSNSVTGGGSSGTTIGPNPGTSVVDRTASPPNAWVNQSGFLGPGAGSAASGTNYETITVTGSSFSPPISIVYSNQHLNSDGLQALGFFTSVSGSSVSGIQLSFQYQSTASVPYWVSSSAGANIQLIKNGIPTGTPKSIAITADGSPHTVTLGGPTDLWGSSFAPVDITQYNFGFQVQTFAGFHHNISNPPDGATTVSYTTRLFNALVTTTMAASSGTSSTSGNGVGVYAAVGDGDVNLSLGRTYYLVGNNSTTGHFSDLSLPSDNTGPFTNGEFDLVLSTYNDPQVDTKYVLATADGGDPSILYEVQVLVPGMVITSWSINGANVATFNGTFYGAFTGVGFSDTQQVVLGGFVHGDYMNGTTVTVTGGGLSFFTATVVHGADSATEPGVAGNLSFAIPNNVPFVIDNDPDPSLVLNQPLVFTDTSGEEYGVTLNDPPPAGNLLIKHQGRLWMAGVPGATHSVFFSKSVTELTLPDGFIAGKYEESWPGSNYFDVSDGAESVAGLLSDGTTLYIGTQNHIRRLIGNSPFNFQEPQIVHPEVGLINQEVWQIVFMQGAPSGAIWLTPDFRVIQSDFNTYVDIGSPIQDILNNLQPTAQSLAHGAFVADGEFELYILAVPYLQSTYCDTHLVFDLRGRQWYVWQPAAGSLSLLFNITQAGVPQWLFLSGDGTKTDIYAATATTDNGVVIPVSATTTWLHLGEPTRRKVLNEVQIYGNTGITMNLYGANNLNDFNATPQPIVYNRALQQSPFGTWNLYLTGAKTRHRYYQFTFNAANGLIPFLGSYAISTMPLDDL